MAENLQEYTPPDWAKSLSKIPTHKIKLAMPDTPIHEWTLPGVPDDFQIHIKREDMTGCALSGNKVSKLEFLFADAISSGCRHFITCGGIQSNYCRAVAVSAARFGMKSHFVVYGDVQTPQELGFQGNRLIKVMCGSMMYIVPHSAVHSYKTQILPRMKQIAEQIKSETGEESYLSGFGGSDAVGIYGHVDIFQELIEQGVHERFDDIVLATGSGGTIEGLALANYLTGSKVKIHGILISDHPPADLYLHGNEILHQLGVDARAEDLYDVISGHQGQGYGIASPEIYEFIQTAACSTGIILDPTYTGKAARGLIQEIQKHPDRFQGRRVLFVHTGGIFCAYDGRLGDVISQSGRQDQAVMWTDLDQSPFK